MSMLKKIRNGKKKKSKKVQKQSKNLTKTHLRFLDQNIMEEIFHNLPYKSLGRCKVVCKQWNSVISSPNFMATHYNHRRPEGNHLILYDFKCDTKYFYFSPVSHINLDNKQPLLWTGPGSNARPGTRLREWGKTQPRLLGSYNGLVAISCYEKLILWNPLIREHTSVDLEVYDSYSDGHRHFETRFLFGLCYDGGKDEYIVVIGTDYQSPPVSPSAFDDDSMDYESMPAWVYNFKEGRERLLTSPLQRRLLDRKLFMGEVGVVICGLPHWVVKFFDFEDPFVKTDILYFDLKDEEFKEMGRPGGGGEKTMLGLGAMDGQNVLGCILHDVVGSRLEVWVMKEYGKPESWSILITFSCLNVMDNFPSSGCMDLLGFIPSGELLIYQNKEFWVYDIGNGNSRRVHLQSFEFVIPYLPTLISPPVPSKVIKPETQMR